MEEEKPLQIPINAIEEDFQDFLTPESNKRIIFSGPFGIGKTYFLDKFFKKEANEEKYLPIFLRPVNYSLLSNEDVFKLIKYDILYQLIQSPEFDIEAEFKITKGEYSKFFVAEHGFSILTNLLKLIPKVQTAVDGVEKIGELIKVYKEGLENINQNEELKMLFDFQTETHGNFLLEYDNVSNFIAQQLDVISQKGEGEQSLEKILIIDDLDRLDPEHIFRLFNVFSAHFDQVNYYSEEGDRATDNKFGFDKIIFVCDIENIRKIFAHKYGAGVDFSGYIDKFYSKRIFYLFHKNAFESYILSYLQGKFSKLPNIGNEFSKIIRFTIELLFEGSQLNIRDVERLVDLHLSKILTKDQSAFKNPEIQLNKVYSQANGLLKHYSICIAIYVLAAHFGSKNILKEKISKAFTETNSNENEYYPSYQFLDLFNDLVLFADFENHKFIIQDEKDEKTFFYDNFSYKLNCGYNDGFRAQGSMWFRVQFFEKDLRINKGQFFKALVEASINIIDSGILDIQ